MVQEWRPRFHREGTERRPGGSCLLTLPQGLLSYYSTSPQRQPACTFSVLSAINEAFL